MAQHFGFTGVFWRGWEKINIQKHGISFEQASYVFSELFALNKQADEHSGEEVNQFFIQKLQSHSQKPPLNEVINSRLKKDIEILNKWTN